MNRKIVAQRRPLLSNCFTLWLEQDEYQVGGLGRGGGEIVGGRVDLGSTKGNLLARMRKKRIEASSLGR